MTTSPDVDHPPPNGPRLLFADHHCKIEAACDSLRACAYTDDPLELIEQYRSFERSVLEHLKAEEDAILPAYAEHAPADAELIRATHDDLRQQLFRIGLDVELHSIRAESLDRLVATLRAHAAHEDREMYPWAQLNLPLRTKRQLFHRIGRSIRLLVLDGERRTAPSRPVAGSGDRLNAAASHAESGRPDHRG